MATASDAPSPSRAPTSGHYRASVERLAQLPFETAFVGHGKPVLQGGSARLREMLEHYFWFTPRWNRLKPWSRSRTSG